MPKNEKIFPVADYTAKDTPVLSSGNGDVTRVCWDVYSISLLGVLSMLLVITSDQLLNDLCDQKYLAISQFTSHAANYQKMGAVSILMPLK